MTRVQNQLTEYRVYTDIYIYIKLTLHFLFYWSFSGVLSSPITTVIYTVMETGLILALVHKFFLYYT